MEDPKAQAGLDLHAKLERIELRTCILVWWALAATVAWIVL